MFNIKNVNVSTSLGLSQYI